jgi:hypothetical protein
MNVLHIFSLQKRKTLSNECIVDRRNKKYIIKQKKKMIVGNFVKNRYETRRPILIFAGKNCFYPFIAFVRYGIAP